MLKKFVQGKSSNTLIEGFLEARISHLEELEKKCSEQDIARYRNCYTMVKMQELLVRHGFTSVQLRLAEPNYYDLKLEERAQFLKTGKEYLCKSMIMENTAYNPEFEG